jgi:hypothetical protein
MDYVTLLHTRWPKDEFIYKPGSEGLLDDVDDLSADARKELYRKGERLCSGLWGTMMMVIGGPVRSAQFDRPFAPEQLCPGERQEQVLLNNRKVHLIVHDGITSTKVFSTIERYRTNSGTVNQWDVGYVRMVGRERPYGLRVERKNSAVMKLRTGHDGACIRVLGGETAAQRGILIHEAPNVAWVIGCIGPRPHGDRSVYENKPGNPSDRSVREIMLEMTKRGGKGNLFVLRA